MAWSLQASSERSARQTSRRSRAVERSGACKHRPHRSGDSPLSFVSKITDGIYFGDIYFLAKLCTYVFTYRSETKRDNKHDRHDVTCDCHCHGVTVTPAMLFGKGCHACHAFRKGVSRFSLLCSPFSFFSLQLISNSHGQSCMANRGGKFLCEK